MILILVLVHVILQEDLGLVVHLRIDVFAQETTNQTDTSKGQRRKRRHLQPMRIRPLKCGSRSTKNFIRLESLVSKGFLLLRRSQD